VPQQQAQRAAYPPPESTVPPQGYPPPAASARRRRAARTAPPSENGLYLPWWSLVLLVGTVGAVAFGLMLAFSILAEPQTPGDQPPRVQVVTSQPTLSQDFAAENPPAGQAQFWPTPIPQAQPTATVALPTPRASQTLPPGEFEIGATVQVVGVETSGLNVRSTPGLTGDPLFLAAENEVFAIVGGPQNANDLEWWKIQDPEDPDRTGWAARNFLMTTSP
jgi:hypothetical protein